MAMTSIRKTKKRLKRKLNDVCDDIDKCFSIRRFPSLVDCLRTNALIEYRNLLAEELDKLKQKKWKKL